VLSQIQYQTEFYDAGIKTAQINQLLSGMFGINKELWRGRVA